MRTAKDHLRNFPQARPSTLSFIERRNEKTEQLRREVEASERAKRKSLIERFMPWFWRRG